MDIEKIFKIAIEYLSDYFATFVYTLQSPGLRFRPVPEAAGTAAGGELAALPGGQVRGVRLDPRLFSFVLLSIFIGSTLNVLIPGGRAAQADFPATAVTVLAVWFFYSLVIHALTRLVESRGTLWETISVSLQLFAVLYVASSFAALLWAALVANPTVRSALLALRWPPLSALVNGPVLVYFLIQFVLLAIYLPLSLKGVHRLNRVEQILIGMLAVVIVLIGYTLYPILGPVLQMQ